MEDAYRFVVLRARQDAEELQMLKETHRAMLDDLVTMGYAEHDKKHPGKVMIKLKLRADEAFPIRDAEEMVRANQLVRVNRDSRDRPFVTYDNVSASFMTRTVFLWLVKRLGFVIVGVTFGYLIIDYVMRLYIPI